MILDWPETSIPPLKLLFPWHVWTIPRCRHFQGRSSSTTSPRTAKRSWCYPWWRRPLLSWWEPIEHALLPRKTSCGWRDCAKRPPCLYARLSLSRGEIIQIREMRLTRMVCPNKVSNRLLHPIDMSCVPFLSAQDALRSFYEKLSCKRP